MEQEKLDRINALAKKAKEGPLTEAELAEQAALRAEYIAAFRASLRGTLASTVIERPDGTREHLTPKKKKKQGVTMNTYTVKRVSSPLTVTDPRWESAPALELAFRWAEYFPSPYTTTARILHCAKGVTVRLETDEWPIRAENTACNGRICDDSCMEFFFTPNTQGGDYINVEINPHGLTHVAIGESRHGRRLLDIEEAGFRIETLIRPREGWCAMVFIPYTFIDTHFATRESTWRANLYKCGELTAFEHYSVWNPIDLPKPDYHQPAFFGELLLSEDII